MKKAGFYLITLLFAGFSSCDKDNTHIDFSGRDLISRILIEGEVHKEFTYNSSFLLNEEKSKFFYTKHTYSNDGHLKESEFYLDPGIFSSSSYVVEQTMSRKEWVNPGNSEKSLTQKFDYDEEGNLARKTYIRPSADNTEYSVFTWEDGRIIKETMYYDNKVSGYMDYQYDAAGNMIKKDKYRNLEDGSVEHSTTTEYEFDNMKNPFRAFRQLLTPGVNTNTNNITKETYTIHFEVDAFIEKVQVTENSYQYNRRGYPVRVNGEAEYIYN
jgi:hypothetical protein